MITKGKIVKIHYSVKVDGKLVESTRNKEPISYVQGQQQLLEGLQKKLEGAKRGDQLEFILTPDEGYGPYRKEAEEDIPKSEVPQFDQVKLGMRLQEKQEDGRIKVGKVIAINENSIRLSFNHPMAGKNLHYSVEVMDVI